MTDSSEGYNNIIIREFKKLLKFYQHFIDTDFGNQKKGERVSKNILAFKYRSTENVISIIESITFPITSSEQLKGIRGIGKNSLKRIDNIIKNGTLDLDERVLQSMEDSQLVDELEKVYGIGRVNAIELIKKYGVVSVEDLKKRVNSEEIKVSETIAKGLKYYDMIKLNIPRSEIDDIYIYLSNKLLSINSEFFGTVCGSYRRLKMFSNDIDYLVTSSSNKNIDSQFVIFLNFIQSIINDGFIVDNFTSVTSQKFMAICRLSPDHPIRRIDIRFIAHDHYYYSLLYFTGSKDFNRKMRRMALDNDMILNEYGLTASDEAHYHAKKEKDIFDFLSMEYVPPDLR